MRINLKNSLFTLIIVSFIIFLPALSLAQPSNVNPPTTPGSNVNPPSTLVDGKIKNPIKAETIDGFIKVVLEGVIKISIPIIALAIIYSGFLFVSARGNSEKLGTAKKALTYSLIGAAILLGSWAIAQIISETVLAL